MSLHEYRASLELASKDPPFYTLIMAAMVKADSDNFEKLRVAFPKTHKDLDLRYHAPDGVLKKDLVERRRVTHQNGSRVSHVEGWYGSFPFGNYFLPDDSAHVLRVTDESALEPIPKKET